MTTKPSTPHAAKPRIPELLQALILAGRWPSTNEEERMQSVASLVPADRIAVFAPEEAQLHLHAPPFHTVAQCLANGEEFWSWPCSAPEGLDYDQAIVLGDFGLGSDAPIVLDYRCGSPRPRVLRLRWVDAMRPERNEWIEITPSFSRFIEMLGI